MMIEIQESKIVAPFISEMKGHDRLYQTMLLLLTALREKHAKIYACGGIIRDTAIYAIHGYKMTLADFDFVIEGMNLYELDNLLKNFSAQCETVNEVIHVGKSFPVWKMIIHGYAQPVDLALTRTEQSFGDHHRDFYVSHDSVSIKADSQRRDFNINAMYIELLADEKGSIHGKLLDFHGGVKSIRNCEIECVGKAEERFREDPLRMLRAIRFRARMPGFSIALQTASAIRKLAPELFHTISKERIGAELIKAVSADPRGALNELVEFGIHKQIFPECEWDDPKIADRICTRIEFLLNHFDDTFEPSLIFAALLFDLGANEIEAEMSRSLGFSNINDRFFRVPSIEHSARRARLPNIKGITKLCSDTLSIIYFDMLKNQDAELIEIFSRYEQADHLNSFYRACQMAVNLDAVDFLGKLDDYPPSQIDFNRLIRNLGIPNGPHLRDIKLRLRQAEIDGEIDSEADAKILLSRIYLEDTYLIQEHINKLHKFLEPSKTLLKLPTDLTQEIRWLLFTRPVRLINAYRQSNTLCYVLPELTEAEAKVRSTHHHFADNFLNDTLLSLSLLYDEEPNPSPVLILSLLFLDIGKAETMKLKADGAPTYYGHPEKGAEMALTICRRLGIDESISGDVYFIISNHNELIFSSAAKRVKKLLRTVDAGLIEDILFVHKIDQLGKMKIRNGKRVDQGQLKNYHLIRSLLDVWLTEAGEKDFQKNHVFDSLITGADLMEDNELWGPGLPEGRKIGKIKTIIEGLQQKGVIKTEKDALNEAGNHIVLYHLLKDGAEYLEILRERGLLTSVLPELAALTGLDQAGPYHREDAYTHTLNVVKALPPGSSPECILSAIFHDIGKAETQTYDEIKGIHHFYGHENRSVDLFEAIVSRFNWTEELFNVSKVIWMIKNHIKIQMDWTKMDKPERTFIKWFYSDNIPPDYRSDLLTLRIADSAGAVIEDPEIKKEKEELTDCLQELLKKTDEDEQKRAEERRVTERIKAIWNGRIVMEFYNVTGTDVGKLVRAGQTYVQECFKAGKEDIGAIDVYKHLLDT